MVSRRQEKVARVIKESVSDTIINRLGDPRIDGMVSITEVDVSPDLRNANVYISIMSADEAGGRKTFAAIEHAQKHIQTLLGRAMTSKYCPHLHFHRDEKLKKTLETLRAIDEVARELDEKNAEQSENRQEE